jgi:hypothetical protein
MSVCCVLRCLFVCPYTLPLADVAWLTNHLGAGTLWVQLRWEEDGVGALFLLVRAAPLLEMPYMAWLQAVYERVRRRARSLTHSASVSAPSHRRMCVYVCPAHAFLFFCVYGRVAAFDSAAVDRPPVR